VIADAPLPAFAVIRDFIATERQAQDRHSQGHTSEGQLLMEEEN
jgi:hypothetical protein